MVIKRRTGATLIEVLTAIFVMGIGLLAILTLFPIGILTMRQAIRDNNTAIAVENAASIAQARNFCQDELLLGKNKVAKPINYFKNPNPAPQAGEATLVSATDDRPSYSVYVDPAGFRKFTGLFADWIAGRTTGIRRTWVEFIRNPVPPKTRPQLIREWFSSLDDINFGFEGAPDYYSANKFRRREDYTWAYLLRRPLFGKPNVVDMTVVVYEKRKTAQPGETEYQATFNPAENIITINWNPDPTKQAPPNLNVGGWILDNTAVPRGGSFGPSHAKFYRVVGFTQRSLGSADLEVQSPLVDFAGITNGSIVVMEGIAEVYEMGVGRHAEKQ